jgi:hypothetical protein
VEVQEHKVSFSTNALVFEYHAVNAPEVLVTSASDQTGPKIKRGKIIFETDICLWCLSVNQPALQQRACYEQMLCENFVCGFTLSYNIIRRGYSNRLVGIYILLFVYVYKCLHGVVV